MAQEKDNLAYQIAVVAGRQWCTLQAITRNPKQITSSIQCHKKRNIWCANIYPCIVQPIKQKQRLLGIGASFGIIKQETGKK